MVGDKARFVCPYCGGGTKHERCLMVRRTEEGVHFRCYRSTCPFNYKFIKNSGVVSYEKRERRHSTRYIGAITYTQEGKPYSETEGRIMYPIHDWEGSFHGYAGRDVTDRLGVSKWKLYWDNYELFNGLYFPMQHRLIMGRSLLLVEDIISADTWADFSMYPHCAAILGTTISLKAASYAVSLGYKHLYIALDNDATEKAHKQAQLLAPLFSSVTVVPLTKDIKNCTPTELWELENLWIDKAGY